MPIPLHTHISICSVRTLTSTTIVRYCTVLYFTVLISLTRTCDSDSNRTRRDVVGQLRLPRRHIWRTTLLSSFSHLLCSPLLSESRKLLAPFSSALFIYVAQSRAAPRRISREPASLSYPLLCSPLFSFPHLSSVAHRFFAHFLLLILRAFPSSFFLLSIPFHFTPPRVAPNPYPNQIYLSVLYILFYSRFVGLLL